MSLRPATALSKKQIGHETWYFVPRSAFDYFGIPGVMYGDAGSWVHRTHLPLAGYAAPAELSAPVVRPLPPGLDYELRPYQRDAQMYMSDRRAIVLAMVQRTGKTATVVSSHDPNQGQLFVCGPLASRRVWLEWVQRRWPGVEVAVLEGRTLRREQLAAPVIFIHYDILMNWNTVGALNIGTLVFDEVQYPAVNFQKMYQACSVLVSQAKRVIASTGTPSWNKVSNLFWLLHLVQPGAWGTWAKFAMRYANAQQTPYGLKPHGASNVAELRARLSEVMYVKLWRDIATDAAPIHRAVRSVELTSGERTAIDEEVKRVYGTQRPKIADLANLRRMLGERKVAVALQHLAELRAKGTTNPVVWCWHNELTDTMSKALDTPYVISSKIAPGKREQRLDEWRTKRDRPLVISIAIGQTALDLSASDTAVFVECDWTPAVVSQAEMRTYLAQRPSYVTFLLTDHWAELQVVESLLSKLQVANHVGAPAGDATMAHVFERREAPEQSVAEWLDAVVAEEQEFVW
jgi:hypothetical protein